MASFPAAQISFAVSGARHKMKKRYVRPVVRSWAARIAHATIAR